MTEAAPPCVYHGKLPIQRRKCQEPPAQLLVASCNDGSFLVTRFGAAIVEHHATAQIAGSALQTVDLMAHVP